MKVMEWNFSARRLYGGLEFIPYQFALGFSIRWGEFSAVRIYIGPLKIWVSI